MSLQVHLRSLDITVCNKCTDYGFTGRSLDREENNDQRYSIQRLRSKCGLGKKAQGYVKRQMTRFFFICTELQYLCLTIQDLSRITQKSFTAFYLPNLLHLRLEILSSQKVKTLSFLGISTF